MLPWCLDLQWKEKLPDGEGARATLRANKISVISRESLSLLRRTDYKRCIAVQRAWLWALYRPDIVLFAYPSTGELQAFSSSRHSREARVVSHRSPSLSSLPLFTHASMQFW